MQKLHFKRPVFWRIYQNKQDIVLIRWVLKKTWPQEFNIYVPILMFNYLLVNGYIKLQRQAGIEEI